MTLNDNFLTYLEKHIPNFSKLKKKGSIVFTCPNSQNHKIPSKAPTCTAINGSDKYYCLQCSWKGTFIDAVKIIEPEKRLDSEDKIMAYLLQSEKIEPYPELEVYEKYKWSLVPVAPNGKNPIENDWTNKTHLDKIEWINWLEKKTNIGVRTGEVSGITVIDVDLKVEPNGEFDEIYKELMDSKTLTQNTPHGRHFVFHYDKDIPQVVKLGGMTIDTRNDGGQILIAPSKINQLCYHWVDSNIDIKIIPENIKAKVLELLKVEKVDNSKVSEEMTQISEEVKAIGEGGRNGMLTSIGGLLINKLSPEQTELVLSIMNQKFMNPPLPSAEVKAMLGSLSGYKETEEQTQEKMIYECFTLVQTDVSAKDIMEHTGLKRAIVDKYLSKFFKEGKAVRRGRGRYDLKSKVEWTNEAQNPIKEYPYKIPYFNDIAYFQDSDIILIGAPQGKGKTHIAMNIIRQMKIQGITPYYISLESGSRHEKIAEQLQLIPKDYYVSKESIDNPLQIEIEPNAFTIIDWLYTGEDFAATLTIFKHLNDEMKKKKGILVVFTQLKENYDYFAVNLIKSFPSLAARYIRDDDTGLIGHFQADKIRDPKGHYSTATVNCKFDFDTKELVKQEIV